MPPEFPLAAVNASVQELIRGGANPFAQNPDRTVTVHEEVWHNYAWHNDGMTAYFLRQRKHAELSGVGCCLSMQCMFSPAACFSAEFLLRDTIHVVEKHDS